MMNDESGDHCPNCRDGFEIVSVKFALSGVQTVTVCPNCARASIWKTVPDLSHERKWQLSRFTGLGKDFKRRGFPQL
jgi:hypothetical protein